MRRRTARGCGLRAPRARDAVLLLVSPAPSAGAAAQALVRADHSRPLWQEGGTTPLLSGIQARLTVERGRAAGEGGPLSLPVHGDAGT